MQVNRSNFYGLLENWYERQSEYGNQTAPPQNQIQNVMAAVEERKELAQVLIVDDCNLNVQILTGILSHNEITSNFVLSGFAALTKLTERIEEIESNEEHEMYRVILLDYSMPIMDGLETAKEIRQLLHRHEAFQPYIVCCSAYDDDNFKEEAYAAGMDDFFTKPVNANELIDKVKAVLKV